jgi:cytochrome P450
MAYLLPAGLHRKALKDHTFHDGTFIPKGTYLVASVSSTHMDPSLYIEPDKFDGLRFYDESPTENSKLLAVPNSGFLAFGYGSHTWYDLFTHSTRLIER